MEYPGKDFTKRLVYILSAYEEATTSFNISGLVVPRDRRVDSDKATCPDLRDTTSRSERTCINTLITRSLRQRGYMVRSRNFIPDSTLVAILANTTSAPVTQPKISLVLHLAYCREPQSIAASTCLRVKLLGLATAIGGQNPAGQPH